MPALGGQPKLSGVSSHPDARQPLVVDTHELTRSPGSIKAVQRTVPAPADLRVQLIGVPQDAEISLDLTLEAVVEGVLVTGRVEAPLEGECARCLAPVHEHGRYEITELYNYPGRDAEDDELFLDGELLDLEPALRDAIVLDLPFTPLCRPDCAGLCPVCGARLNDDPEHSHPEQVDPRWSGLGQLRTEETQE